MCATRYADTRRCAAAIFYLTRTDGTRDHQQSSERIAAVSNSLLQMLPHHRSPVILNRKHESRWLRQDLPLADVTKLLKPYPADLMNAYPIDPAIKNPRAEGKELLKPIGERVIPEFDARTKEDLELQGMGSEKNFRYDSEWPWGG
ncbi:MAG: SOS response-associated peptidase family protein [Bacteroidetes bacterium]|nr:SOS response-associated peptidase family protein [Bacteroidota bacterium]